jgi:NADPH-dependent glutamate synthase beta subunit-like oxidoreductase/Pyruvate/2-oxoacid:ferredoxin oxidoreductase delta subunit
MSPPGRPKGEYRSAQREGTPLDPPGRPKGEYRSAPREGAPVNAKDPGPSIWTTGNTEVFKTGTWRSALPQHIRAPAPCHAACPVDGDIAEWIGRARARDFRGAWEILTRHNPFPAVAGRICHHPCETACNRASFDDSLAICRLERHVGDQALAEGWTFAPVEIAHKERIAVVGAGPSGLSAAFHLRRRGYAVTLLESSPELGGLMRYGIPAYRLARPVLDGEIARVVALGVDVRLGEAMATCEDFERLRKEFDAVYLAIGAGSQKRLPRLDYARPWVMDGADYLARANAGVPPTLGRRVVVIGGGSAALDVARSARRLGHEVTILALESAEQMPAQRDEIAEALEEGIALVDGAMLTEAIDTGNAGLTLRCVRVRFQAGATRGQFTVTPLADSEFSLAADAIVPSIGQDPELAPLEGTLEIDGALVKTGRQQATSLERVYAGGDVSSMARFVTEAIGMGQRAAHEIDRVLRARAEGDSADAGANEAAEPVVAFATINTFYYPAQARTPEARLPVAQRLAGDAEVQLGFDLDGALAETRRCFSCGTCIQCDNCVVYCPDLAVKREGDGYVVLTDFCKGCGICVKECPTGSMKMTEEDR